MASQTLAAAADDYFALRVARAPVDASLLGVADAAHEALPDLSTAAEERERRTLLALADRVAAIDVGELEERDRVSHSVLAMMVDADLAQLDQRWPDFTLSSFPTSLPSYLLSTLPKVPVTTSADADAFLERLARIPTALEQTLERLRAGAADGLTPTRRGVESAAAQARAYVASPLDEDQLVLGLREVLGQDDGGSPLGRARRLLVEEVRPAYARFAEAVTRELLEVARPDEQAGVCHVPDGQERYAVALRARTTTALPAREVHDLGLAWVAELGDAYRRLGPQVLGTSDLDQIFGRLREDPALHYDDPSVALDDARAAIIRAEGVVGPWFGRLPTTRCRVAPMLPLEGSNAAYYRPPAQGEAYGTYWLNVTGPVLARFESEAVAFHEALPGHHLQIALQMELDLPDFRRLGAWLPGYIEGWALYAERLADEMGLYSDDVARLGMLAADSLRLCRLVVDTGLHHWAGPGKRPSTTCSATHRCVPTWSPPRSTATSSTRGRRAPTRWDAT